MLMDVNPRVSKHATCSYTTVADYTCKTTATTLCSSCERFACAVHVLKRDGTTVCAACTYQLEQLAKRFDESPAFSIAGIPISA